jgi:hypothetical protein
MQIKDNIFRRKFHARELNDWFLEQFPKSYPIEIFKGDNPWMRLQQNSEVWSPWNKGVCLNHQMFPTEYTLDPYPTMGINSSDETFIRFMIEDDKKDTYIVRWGYKCREADPEDYAAILVALIFDTCYQRKLEANS